jgi:hypothetical protein
MCVRGRGGSPLPLSRESLVKTRPGIGFIARLLSLVPLLCALAGFSTIPRESGILFSRGSPVPSPVQQFAWRVIEARCNYQSYERGQRVFWASDARAAKRDGETVYSIHVLSELSWRKSEPSAVIDMTIVDNGRLRLTALRSSFVVCSL